MTAGETYQSCLKEIEDLPACKKYAKDIKVSMYMYDRPSWTGHVYETEAFFPTWINKETAPHVQALVDAHHALWGTERIGADEKAMSTRTGRPLTDKWTFSTNGVSIQAATASPASASAPALNLRPTRPTRSPGSRTSSPARRCTRLSPASTSPRTRMAPPPPSVRS